MFAPPEIQLENLRRWNQDRQWGLDEPIDQLPEPPRPKNPGEMTTVVLTPYLETPQRTLDELWDICEKSGEYRTYRHGQDWPKTQITTKPGVCHNPMTVQWEVIDLMAEYEPRDIIKPANDYSGTRIPNAGVLAIATHSPRWVKSFLGKEVRSPEGTPCIGFWIPGYQMTVGTGPFVYTPVIWQEGHWLSLNFFLDKRAFAIPAFAA
jgi:hypothetical protein